MKEESKKGVIVEFDFAAANGAEILYRTTEQLLKDNEIAFGPRVEAQHLAGGNYQGGLAEYFNIVKTKKTAAKAAKDLATAFQQAMTDALPAAVTGDVKDFIGALLGKGLKVVVATRADQMKARDAFADFIENPNFALYEEISTTYGGVKWDDWRRASSSNRVRSYLALAVAGSGFSVKSALLAGMGAVAVVSDRVAWQDFGGADELFDKLDRATAEKVSSILRV